jgi:hypothetical protein
MALRSLGADTLISSGKEGQNNGRVAQPTLDLKRPICPRITCPMKIDWIGGMIIHRSALMRLDQSGRTPSCHFTPGSSANRK